MSVELAQTAYMDAVRHAQGLEASLTRFNEGIRTQFDKAGADREATVHRMRESAAYGRFIDRTINMLPHASAWLTSPISTTDLPSVSQVGFRTADEAEALALTRMTIWGGYSDRPQRQPLFIVGESKRSVLGAAAHLDKVPIGNSSADVEHLTEGFYTQGFNTSPTHQPGAVYGFKVGRKYRSPFELHRLARKADPAELALISSAVDPRTELITLGERPIGNNNSSNPPLIQGDRRIQPVNGERQLSGIKMAEYHVLTKLGILTAYFGATSSYKDASGELIEEVHAALNSAIE